MVGLKGNFPPAGRMLWREAHPGAAPIPQPGLQRRGAGRRGAGLAGGCHGEREGGAAAAAQGEEQLLPDTSPAAILCPPAP